MVFQPHSPPHPGSIFLPCRFFFFFFFFTLLMQMRFWISSLTCQNKGNDNWQLSIFFWPRFLAIYYASREHRTQVLVFVLWTKDSFWCWKWEGGWPVLKYTHWLTFVVTEKWGGSLQGAIWRWAAVEGWILIDEGHPFLPHTHSALGKCTGWNQTRVMEDHREPFMKELVPTRTIPSV